MRRLFGQWLARGSDREPEAIDPLAHWEQTGDSTPWKLAQIRDGDLGTARDLFARMTEHVETRPLSDLDPLLVEWYMHVLRRVADIDDGGVAAQVFLGRSRRRGRPRLTEWQQVQRHFDESRLNRDLCRLVATALDLDVDEVDAVTGSSIPNPWRPQLRMAVKDAAQMAGVREQRVYDAVLAEDWDLGSGKLSRDRLQRFVHTYAPKFPT